MNESSEKNKTDSTMNQQSPLIFMLESMQIVH